MISTAIVQSRGEDRIRSGHPWIYKSDVADVAADPGDVVTVMGARHRELGHALFSAQSQITLRMISRDEHPVDRAFWRGRLESAIRFRHSLRYPGTRS